MTDPHPARTGIILVAAGRGERLGAELPKALVHLAGRTLIDHALNTIVSLPWSGDLVVVAPEAWLGAVHHQAHQTHGFASVTDGWRITVIAGGVERHESVRLGLAAMGDDIDTVLVHDAARPLTPDTVFTEVRDAVHRHRCGVVPALPVADTLKSVAADGTIEHTIDRGSLIAVQTPQGFPRALLERAHAEPEQRAPHSPVPVTDDAELVQRVGGVVRTVPGSMRAHKVTTPDDLKLLDALAVSTGSGTKASA